MYFLRFFLLVIILLIALLNKTLAQNIAINTTGTAAAAANLFEVTQAGGNNTVGIFSSHTGTGTNAYAIWAQATGATNKYAIVVPAGGGNVGIGTTAPQNTLHVLSDIPNTTTNLHPYRTGVMVEGDLNTFGGRIAIRQAGTNPCLTLYRNNGTIAAPTTLISGDMIGNLAFGGYDGSAVIASPGITSVAAETWGASAHGSHLVFNTINLGSSGSTEKMRLNSEGNLGVGTSTPVWDVDVTKANASSSVIVNVQNTSAGATAGAGFLAQNDGGKWAEMALNSSTSTNTTFGLTNANFANFLANTEVAFGTSSANAIIFGTNNVERMRLLGAGTLKITGTTITSPGIWMEGTITSAAGTSYGILSRGTLTAVANGNKFIPFSTNLGTANTGTYTGLTFYGGHFDGATWAKSGTGTIDNSYGLYVTATASTFATNNYAGIFTGGNVGIGTTAPAATLHVDGLTGRQVITGGGIAWVDLSSNAAGRGLMGGNMYTDWTGSTFHYSATHGSIGAVGFATNYPTWNQASIITSGTTSSTAGTAFTPTMIATFDYSGKVGIGTTSPATKLDVQGTSGTTLKIVDGNQAAGKVLTSDAAGVASWTNGPYASGSGNIVLLYNDETSSAGLNMTTASVKSFTIPATYTKVKVETEVEDDANTSGIWTFNIVYNGATVRSVPMTIVAAGAKNVISFSYTGAIASGQVVRIDAVQTSGKNVFVRNFRVYGIY